MHARLREGGDLPFVREAHIGGIPPFGRAESAGARRERGRRMGMKGYRRGGAAVDRLNLEALEERVAPAGAVTVASVGGYLVVTGDADANDIVIDQAGLAAGEYRISSGLDATTINGEASVVLSAAKGMKLAMGGGNDVVNLDTVATGALTFDGGEGDNTFGINNTTVTGNVKVKNGSGFDTTDLDGTISGNVSIANGDGGSDVDLTASIAGKASVKNGAGNDSFSMNGGIGKNLDIADGAGASDIGIEGVVTGSVTIKDGDGIQTVAMSWVETGKVTISHGAGDSSLTVANGWTKGISVATKGAGTHSLAITNAGILGGVSFSNSEGDSSVSLNNVEMDGALSIKNGTGFDTVDAAGAQYAALTVKNGDGGSDLLFDDCFVSKGCAIANGDGANDLRIAGGEVVGSTSIRNGDGDSTIAIGYTYLGFARDNGGLKIQEGLGNHDIDLEVAVGTTTSVTTAGATSLDFVRSTLQGNVTIKTGGGADAVAFADRCNFGGGLSVSTGDGADTVHLDDIVVQRNTALNTGDGDDILTIETADFAGVPSAFEGKISLLMGDGNDTATIGLDGDADDHIEAHGAILADGGAGDSDSITAGDSNIFAGEPVLKGFEILHVPVAL